MTKDAPKPPPGLDKAALTEWLPHEPLGVEDRLRRRAESAAGAPSAGGGSAGSPEGRAARVIYAYRRRREQLLQLDMFGEPAWDMLLDLFASQEEGRRVDVSGLCLAALVPQTTALRWITMMVDRGILIRKKADGDGRRVWIELAPAIADRMRLLLRSIADNPSG